jgi:hypothetical protein
MFYLSDKPSTTLVKNPLLFLFDGSFFIVLAFDLTLTFSLSSAKLSTHLEKVLGLLTLISFEDSICLDFNLDLR